MNNKIKNRLIYLPFTMINQKIMTFFLSKTKVIKYTHEKQEIFIPVYKEYEIGFPVQIWIYLNYDCFS